MNPSPLSSCGQVYFKRSLRVLVAEAAFDRLAPMNSPGLVQQGLDGGWLDAYLPGAGLRMHADDHVLKPDGSVLTRDVQRGITAILYLNSNFAGGEIRFPKQGLELRPSAGLLVIFPSNRNFPHEVKPILRGRRYSYQRIYGILDGRTGSFEV